MEGVGRTIVLYGVLFVLILSAGRCARVARADFMPPLLVEHYLPYVKKSGGEVGRGPSVPPEVPDHVVVAHP